MKKHVSLVTALIMALSVFSSFNVMAEEVISISTAEEMQAAVTNGGSYKVADGIEEIDCGDITLQIRKNIDLDLNGAVVKVNNDGFNFQNYELEATIKNGVISGSGNYAVKAMAKTPSVINLENIETTGTKNGVASANSYYIINITGSKINGTTAGIAATMGHYTVKDAETGGITASNASTLDFENTTITSTGSGIAAYGTASVTLDNCTITGKVNNYGVFWKTSGDLAIKDTQITMDTNGKGVIHTDSAAANVTIENSTLTNTCTAANKALVMSSNSTDASVYTINGGTYTGLFGFNAASSTSLTVTGGTFSSDPSDYLADGLAAFVNDDGMYEVTDASLIPTEGPTDVPATQDPNATATPSPEPTVEPTPVVTPEPTPVPELTVDEIFTSDMIFQRNKPIKVSGTGISGRTVTVSFNGEEASDLIEHGVWSVELPSMEALKSADMVITSEGNTITLTNIAVGEVIVMSGQSNMFRDFNSFRWLADEVDADYPDIRLYSCNTAENGWQPATTENAMNFSATGFMTGKRLYQNTGGEIPIGLIRAAYDGSNIMSWISSSSAFSDPDLYQMYNSCQTKSKWHTAYIKPIQKLNIGGVMWYQGEGNTWYKNNNYEKALTTLIESWRDEWNDQELPFAVVQLPTADFNIIYGNRTPSNTGGFCTGIGVRDAQWQVSQKLENVTTVVSIDTGRKTEVHPQDKQPIADRAAKVFEHYLMGNDTDAYQSPSYDHMEITEDGKTVIHFKNVYDKLISKDVTEIKGFTAAGEDGVFEAVSAEISSDGQTVIVDTSGIEDPQVRYAWSDTPSLDESDTQYYSNINLVNESGFAVAPFRTDTGKYMYMLGDDDEHIDCNFVPWIREIAPADGSTEDGSVTVTVKADDVDGEVTAVEIFVDEASVGSAEKSGDVWVKEVSGLSDGTHTVYAVATDDSGAVSTKQDGSMGTETELKPPKMNAFLVGSGLPERTVSFDSAEDVSEYFTTSGEGSEAGAGAPAGYFKDVIKLSAKEAKGSAALTVPVNAEAGYNTIELETSVYIESSANANANDSSTVIELQMSDGASKTLFMFTNTSLRIGGNYYEILRGTKQAGEWYDLKLVIDVYNGTFSAWVDGELMYMDQGWIYPVKDYDKQYEWYQSLKAGINALKITHTQSAADVSTASYIDNTSLTLSSYDDTPAPEASVDVKYEDGTVKASFENLTEPAVMYAAAYKDGVLAGIRMITVDEPEEEIPFAFDDADSIKVYIWDTEQGSLFAPVTLR